MFAMTLSCVASVEIVAANDTITWDNFVLLQNITLHGVTNLVVDNTDDVFVLLSTTFDSTEMVYVLEYNTSYTFDLDVYNVSSVSVIGFEDTPVTIPVNMKAIQVGNLSNIIDQDASAGIAILTINPQTYIEGPYHILHTTLECDVFGVLGSSTEFVNFVFSTPGYSYALQLAPQCKGWDFVDNGPQTLIGCAVPPNSARFVVGKVFTVDGSVSVSIQASISLVQVSEEGGVYLNSSEPVGRYIANIGFNSPIAAFAKNITSTIGDDGGLLGTLNVTEARSTDSESMRRRRSDSPPPPPPPPPPTTAEQYLSGLNILSMRATYYPYNISISANYISVVGTPDPNYPDDPYLGLAIIKPIFNSAVYTIDEVVPVTDDYPNHGAAAITSDASIGYYPFGTHIDFSLTGTASALIGVTYISEYDDLMLTITRYGKTTYQNSTAVCPSTEPLDPQDLYTIINANPPRLSSPSLDAAIFNVFPGLNFNESSLQLDTIPCPQNVYGFKQSTGNDDAKIAIIVLACGMFFILVVASQLPTIFAFFGKFKAAKSASISSSSSRKRTK